MIPTLILVGIIIGLCRPYRAVRRWALAILALVGASLLWGVVVSVGDEVIDPVGVWLAAANGVFGWVVGAAIAGAASAVAMLMNTTRRGIQPPG